MLNCHHAKTVALIITGRKKLEGKEVYKSKQVKVISYKMMDKVVLHIWRMLGMLKCSLVLVTLMVISFL